MHGLRAYVVAPLQAHCNMIQPVATWPCMSALLQSHNETCSSHLQLQSQVRPPSLQTMADRWQPCCAGKEIVVWRDAQQQWRAFEDLCPHRKVLLSEGRVHQEEGTLECAYHGERCRPGLRLLYSVVQGMVCTLTRAGARCWMPQCAVQEWAHCIVC